jgi:excinuclease ABC subunit A
LIDEDKSIQGGAIAGWDEFHINHYGRGVLYVLDEPTIGMHARNTKRLIEVMRQLRDLGDTVLVIEHDMEVLRTADFVVDVGPGAGKNGGTIVVTGAPETVAACPESVTGAYLSGRLVFPVFGFISKGAVV